MAIKILRKGLPVIGYAKIGIPTAKDSRWKGAPRKLDHIELTGRERGSDGELLPDVKLLERLVQSEHIPTCGGPQGGCERSKELARSTGISIFAERGLPRRLPIMLPYSSMDLNMPNHLTWWRGKVPFCVGDGEAAMRRTEIALYERDGRTPKMRHGKPEIQFGPAVEHLPCGSACPEFRVRCKPFGKLRFILATQESVGGCFEWHTTSWNSLANITESLEFIATITGGVLAWIPLFFEVSAQTVTAQESGQSSTAFIARVTYPGNPQQLLESVTEQLQLRAPMLGQIRQLEATIRGETPWNETPEEIAALRREFDPDAPEEPVEIVDTEGEGAPGEGEGAGEAPAGGDDFLGDAAPPAQPRATEPATQRRSAPQPKRELSVATLPEVQASQKGGQDDWLEGLGWK